MKRKSPYVVALLACVTQVASLQVPAPRLVRIDGQRFVVTKTNATIVLGGANVVVKGPPYLPAVSGSSYCDDVVNDDCKKKGTCISCETFNQGDIDHMKKMGWNSIRLGVVWAGAQVCYPL